MYVCVYMCVCVYIYIYIFFFFLPDFSTWIFGHQFKLQISKIKWTNSHHLCKTTPTYFSSSWLSCLSKGHHILLPKWKTWKSFLTAAFSTTSNQSPSYVSSTFYISLQVMHVCILLPIHYYKAIIFSVLWLFRILPLLPLLRVIIPSCPQF